MPSSHHQPARLTKKQKKATAFRERGSGKPKGKGKGKGTIDGYDHESDDEDANAIPAMEDQDQALAAMAGYTSTEGDAKGDDSVQSRHAIRVPKKTAMESTSTAAQSKKKKRGSSSRAEELGGSEEAQPGPKKKKARLTCSSEEILPEREEDGATSMKDDGDGSKTKSKGNKPLRYILFIGNLKYTTTREAIQKHFALCDPPPTIRLLTPKVTRAAGVGVTAAAKSKSKGCAFLEFSTRQALQAALRLHQSELDGRRINVELTAGGGGKSDVRLAKVKERNKLLGAQRTRRLKEATAQGEDVTQHEHLQPQRFSTTSGEGEVPRTKRTWTIGDGDQGGERHGITKAEKKRGTRTKNWGTGVNALPIG